MMLVGPELTLFHTVKKQALASITKLNVSNLGI